MSAKNHIPPNSAQRFLNWFLRDDLAEEVHGDLEEQFYANLESASIFKARLIYWYQVINYLRPFAITESSSHFIFYAMVITLLTVSYQAIKAALMNPTESLRAE